VSDRSVTGEGAIDEGDDEIGGEARARVAGLFTLEQVDDATFRARTSRTGPGRFPGMRLFGGQVASQALRAAAHTVDDAHGVNSLHAYFLRGGRYGVPVDYEVDRIRDGASFTTRRVVAMQEGEAILNLDASFHRDEPGCEHQPPSPVDLVASPEEAVPPEEPPWTRGRPVDMRWVESPTPGVRSVWVRVPGRLGDDPTTHACLLTFVSDMGPVSVVGAALDAPRERRMMASLDHCMWFHHPVRADEWVLYQLEAVATARARGVARGSIWTRDGRLAVTLVQEVLARPIDPARRPAGSGDGPPR
jgi:acyl-CoA thioesterase II